MAQATLLVRHQVEDYAAWRSVYDSVEGLREQHGCTGAEVMVDPADKQDVYVLHRFPTLEQAQAFAVERELREAMGVPGSRARPGSRSPWRPELTPTPSRRPGGRPRRAPPRPATRGGGVRTGVPRCVLAVRPGCSGSSRWWAHGPRRWWRPWPGVTGCRTPR